ncbi:hypothetical protein [Aquimarina sp. Aq107]|uniref:hypothetical protein n=1 Tax=Aquimarina sp. Aq107 TaxID=1191912 RepID=UPI000D54D7E1|nr:hypothetical protein [Aquimarina sp. Aq107]
MVKILKRIKILFLFCSIISCSTYFGQEDINNRLRINDKHSVLKIRSKENVLNIINTEVLYLRKYSFTNNNSSFLTEYDSSWKTYKFKDHYLRFFKTGHVNKFTVEKNGIYLEKNKDKINPNIATQGFYAINTNEFEIEFFQKQNISIGGSMDHYLYKALISNNKLHLIIKEKKNYYRHYIYIKQEMPEALKNQTADW